MRFFIRKKKGILIFISMLFILTVAVVFIAIGKHWEKHNGAVGMFRERDFLTNKTEIDFKKCFDSDSPGLLKRDSNLMVVSASECSRVTINSRAISIKPQKSPDMFLFSCYVNSKTIHSNRIEVELDGYDSFVSREGPSFPGKREILTVFLPDVPKKNIYEFKINIRSTADEAVFTNCFMLSVYDDRFEVTKKCFFEDFYYLKGKRKRIVAIGYSTLVDNSGPFPFPFILQLLLEAYLPGEYEIMNMSSWSATMLDYIYNWHMIQECEEDRPFFSQASLQNNLIALWTDMGPESSGSGIKDLKPDAIIICPMWNDSYLKGFYSKYWENKDVPGRQGVPIQTELMLYFVDYMLTKDSRILLEADSLKYFLLNEIGVPATDIKWLNPTVALYANYRVLLARMIREIKDDAPGTKIILLALPFGIGHSFDDKYRENALKQLDMCAYDKDPGFNLDFFIEVDKMQINVMRELSKEIPGLFFVDLSTRYQTEMENVLWDKFDKMSYFTNDLMHFNSSGNEYIADYLFMELRPFLEEW